MGNAEISHELSVLHATQAKSWYWSIQLNPESLIAAKRSEANEVLKAAWVSLAVILAVLLLYPDVQHLSALSEDVYSSTFRNIIS